MLGASPLRAEEPEWDPDLPVEAQKESEEARSTARFTVLTTYGWISDLGGGGGPGIAPRHGPTFALSKPFYMGTRWRYAQFMLEARVSAGWVPNQFVLLQTSPMWGGDFFFGPYVGIEAKLGLGLAAQFRPGMTYGGFAFRLESGSVLRVFKDDRTRLKLIAGVGMQVFVGQTLGGLSADVGLAFETAL